jgi:hypothetical protein
LQGIKEVDLLVGIGERITKLFEHAHGRPAGNDEALGDNLRQLAGLALRRTMGGDGTRRLLVRTWTQALRLGHEHGFRALSTDEIERLLDGTADDLAAAEVAAVATEGE